MALQVGIVGLPNAGKTSLFRALTGAETTGRDNVGMAAVPDDRLRQLAETVGAKKVTPAAVRVVDVPGTGAELLGNLRQVDLMLAVLDGWSGTRDARSDSEELTLELLAADRDHVQRRLERVDEAGEVGRHEAARGGREPREARGAPREPPGRERAGWRRRHSRRSSSC